MTTPYFTFSYVDKNPSFVVIVVFIFEDTDNRCTFISKQGMILCFAVSGFLILLYYGD